MGLTGPDQLGLTGLVTNGPNWT